MNQRQPTCADVQAAQLRILPFIHRTPTLTSQTLDAMAGVHIFFKCENFQKIGAFKARGAHNALFSLTPEQRQAGVVTHSSGNHAAALALAARNAGTVAHVVMPSNAPQPKVESVQRLGGIITHCEPTAEAREATAAQVQAATGAIMIHPFDNWEVITGQGTAALELVQDHPDLDAIVTPVGGGGLLSGTAIVAAAHGIKVFGAEPQGADDAQRSLRTGQRQSVGVANTIADGLRTSLGERPFQVIMQSVSDIATVSDEEIVGAMLLAWQILKIIIEPSCAVPLAAILNQRLPLSGQRVGVILSGGNVDLRALPW
ncbi:MAG: pyridoxal-phosphate dependent enzyme [Pirellulaceae bacterium]|nr:pyridoxal-phosphate dependent enzyme [Pirellulaceae bacterium]